MYSLLPCTSLRACGALAVLLLLGACAHSATPTTPLTRRSDELPAGVIPPQVLEAPSPPFPYEMRRVGREAVVRVLCLIGPDGRLQDVGAVSGDPLSTFAREAVAAVKRWKFAPATRDGKPVAMQVVVPIRFSFDPAPDRAAIVQAAR